ncbi:MAG: hypothetical protein AAF963_02840, partial [Bacteroidota bacterium]
MKLLTAIKGITIFFVVIAAMPLKTQPLEPTQWYQINTPHVNLIFRGGMGEEAQRVANTLTHLYEPVAQSLGAQPTPIPLVLWGQNFVSNG